MARRRETRQRQIILETVRAHQDHPSAEEIYLEVRAKDPKISRGTVYRNLNCLSEDGEISHIKVPETADRFDFRTDRHYHMQCIRCGAVMDAPEEYRQEMDQEVAGRTGFQVVCHRTVFEGICPECQKLLSEEASS